MMSLVPVASPDLIVTWGPVDVGSGDINVTTTYELKTEVSAYQCLYGVYSHTKSNHYLVLVIHMML